MENSFQVMNIVLKSTMGIRAVATEGCGGCNTPQASSLSENLLRIKVLSAIFRKYISLPAFFIYSGISGGN